MDDLLQTDTYNPAVCLFLSVAGAKKCSSRPPCTTQDYFAINTPCDLNGMASVAPIATVAFNCNQQFS